MASNQSSRRGLLVLASALTKVHPGAGRSPGVVDLPVIRDPLGYPFIPGSMLKGSLRTFLNKKEKNKLVCLFGSDIGEAGNHGFEKYTGALIIQDLYPLFLPAPSSDYGIVYVTTHYLLSRAIELSKALGYSQVLNDLELMVEKAGESTPVLFGSSNDVRRNVRIGPYQFSVRETVEINLSNIMNEISDLHALYRNVPFNKRIIIVPPETSIPLIESLMMRVTRVRVNRETKTVEQGGLWTEEYIPWGTLFTGAVIDNGFRNPLCSNHANPIDMFKEIFPSGFISLVIGGKETVGGGMIKLKLVDNGG